MLSRKHVELAATPLAPHAHLWRGGGGLGMEGAAPGLLLPFLLLTFCGSSSCSRGRRVFPGPPEGGCLEEVVL